MGKKRTLYDCDLYRDHQLERDQLRSDELIDSIGVEASEHRYFMNIRPFHGQMKRCKEVLHEIDHDTAIICLSTRMKI
jgi:hypothetical protein